MQAKQRVSAQSTSWFARLLHMWCAISRCPRRPDGQSWPTTAGASQSRGKSSPSRSKRGRSTTRSLRTPLRVSERQSKRTLTSTIRSRSRSRRSISFRDGRKPGASDLKAHLRSRAPYHLLKKIPLFIGNVRMKGRVIPSSVTTDLLQRIDRRTSFTVSPLKEKAGTVPPQWRSISLKVTGSPACTVSIIPQFPWIVPQGVV